MKLTKSTILELQEILRDEFNIRLDGKELENFAYSLVGYFDLLVKISHKQRKFGNSPTRLIDTNHNKLENGDNLNEN